MKKILIILLILACGIPAFAKKRPEETIITPMTQLQKRQYQTRTYNDDKILVMKSLLNVFQDEGYIVYNVNSLLGFVYGVKDFDTTDPNIDISKEFGFTKSRLNYNGVKIATLETTANITEYGKDVRVRVNFKRKLLNEYGNAQFIDDIEEATFYEEFYKKVDTALNLQKQTNTKIETKEVEAKVVEPVIEKVIEAAPIPTVIEYSKEQEPEIITEPEIKKVIQEEEITE